MKKNSPLENLLSKYFNQFQDLTEEEVNIGQFDPENTLHQIKKRINKKNHHNYNKYIVAACLAIVCGVSLYVFSPIAKVQTVTASTKVGEIKTIILPDGSKVWLNAKSELHYSQNFGAGKEREITLNGEGYFEVRRNETKPFIIHTQNLKTTVLGTTFNINAYESDLNASVTVVSGKVAVEDEGVKLVLVENEQALFQKSDKKLIKNNVKNATSNILWKEGRLVFKSVTLEEVIASIQRNHLTEIEISENIKKCKISADFTGLSIEKTIKILGEIVNGSSTFKNNKFYLNGKGCI